MLFSRHRGCLKGKSKRGVTESMTLWKDVMQQHLRIGAWKLISNQCDARPKVLLRWSQSSKGEEKTSSCAISHQQSLGKQLCASALPGSSYLGFNKGLEERYDLQNKIGEGGNGVVRIAKMRQNGKEYACKTIKKILGPEYSELKRASHLESLRREVAVLQKLKGCLNVVEVEAVYEDEEHIHLIMECCKGGELWHRIGSRHYSERTVASYMRAVLRTLAVMHSHHILHRDVKPGNFMLLTDSTASPLKAIDFGLAMPYDPKALPLSDLGMEGTPWYMAPEVLSSQVGPASDVWSAGVMAYQLLTGRFPFDDKHNPSRPAVSAIWKSILIDPLRLDLPCWSGISDEAKSFVALLLERDPAKRLTAKQALEHPFLRGNISDRSAGKKLSRSVVQRIQRFGRGGVFKRTVLQAIAAELLARSRACEEEVSAQAPHKSAAANTCGEEKRSTAGQDGDREYNSTDCRDYDALCDADMRVDIMPRGSIRSVVVTPNAGHLRSLYQQLDLEGGKECVDAVKLAIKLRALGFKLEDSEVSLLLQQVDSMSTQSGQIQKSALAASQLDWKELQQHHYQHWRRLVHNTFEGLDRDHDGILKQIDLTKALRACLPEERVDEAVAEALMEAGHSSADSNAGIDFETFMNMLKVSSLDSLDMYDDRIGGSSHLTHASSGSVDRLNALLQADPSLHSSTSRDGSRRGLYGSMSTNGGSQRGSTARSAEKSGGVTSPLYLGTLPAGSSLTGSCHKPVQVPAHAVNKLASTAFRFDVGGKEDMSPIYITPSLARQCEDSVDERGWVPGSLPASSVSTTIPQSSLSLGPGHHDLRFHGSSLYKNAVLGGHKLSGGRPKLGLQGGHLAAVQE